MKNKLNKTWTEKGPVAKDVGSPGRNETNQQPFEYHLQVNNVSRIIDPKILQRYSFDDNGGSYRGL